MSQWQDKEDTQPVQSARKTVQKKSIRFLPLFVRIDVYKRAILSNQAQAIQLNESEL